MLSRIRGPPHSGNHYPPSSPAVVCLRKSEAHLLLSSVRHLAVALFLVAACFAAPFREDALRRYTAPLPQPAYSVVDLQASRR